MAHQAATALANARLVAGLQTSLAQVRISTTQLVEARAEQRLLLRELVDAEERQRAALARDLHDDALQEVLYPIRHARLCIELAQHAERTAVVRARVDDTPLGGLGGDAAQEGSRAFGAGAGAGRLTQELRQIAERAELAEQRLRALYQGLYPALLPALGLPAALEELGRELSISGDVSIEADCTAEAREAALGLDGEAALHVYRIAQEALRNADKHAAARTATLRLTLAAAIRPHVPHVPAGTWTPGACCCWRWRMTAGASRCRLTTRRCCVRATWGWRACVSARSASAAASPSRRDRRAAPASRCCSPWRTLPLSVRHLARRELHL